MAHESLTPAQAERLEMLAEEAAEVVQACTKILRHGYDSYHPDHLDVGLDNCSHLKKELTDLSTIKWAMFKEGDMEFTEYDLETKWRKKLSYTHHQKAAV